jgi:NADH-quinone oxidoreductase subunit K
MHPVIPYVIGAGLFGIGCYGVLVRRNAVLLLMAVELMLNAVNLILVTADTTVRAVLPHSGQVLAVVLQLFRLRQSVAVDEVRLDSGPDIANGDDAGNPNGRHAAPSSAGAAG